MIRNIILDYGHGGLTSDGTYTTAPAKMHTFPNGEMAYEGVINRQIGGILEMQLRYDFSDQDKDKEADFYVLKKTNCPAVLLECLFFDNWDDFNFLKNPEFQKELAWHIYLGIIDYVKPS
ncbi:MAG: N-acetylmuramoyl-L-alanine amidase [Bacteroidetes bacterium]|nr:MAG: N-acetylmuramoyl-L-alanine amidase [Bacteroidota bacterium]